MRLGQGTLARRVHVGGTGAAAAVAAVYLRAVDPSTGGWFPSCPLRSLTGVWCPACGMTRATHHLLHGDLSTAVRYNLLVVPVLVALAVLVIGRTRRTLGAADRPGPLDRRSVVGVVSAVAVFTVVRNIPALELLRGLPA